MFGVCGSVGVAGGHESVGTCSYGSAVRAGAGRCAPIALMDGVSGTEAASRRGVRARVGVSQQADGAALLTMHHHPGSGRDWEYKPPPPAVLAQACITMNGWVETGFLRRHGQKHRHRKKTHRPL